MDTKIVITGIGSVNAIGKSIEEFSDSLRNGVCGIRKMQHDDYNISQVDVYAPIDWQGISDFDECLEDVNNEHKLVERARKTVRRCSDQMQIAMVASVKAWNMSKIEGSISSERVGIVVSGSNLGQNQQYELVRHFLCEPEYITPRYALSFMDTDFVGTISDVFQIRGAGFSIGGASASGNMAIINAMQQIELGNIDACMVVGVPTFLSPMEIQAFINIGAMDANAYEDVQMACKPFDEEHKGFVYGQGAGCVVLESKEHAIHRKAKIYAELIGGFAMLDGNRFADPNIRGEMRAMRGALKKANITPKKINYINTHGTASKLGDQAELDAIRQVFGEHAKDIYINSTKGYTGHCLFSAGIIELIATVVQMNGRFLHGNKGLVVPIEPVLNLPNNTVEDVDINYAISNAFGFGGINTSIVVSRGQV